MTVVLRIAPDHPACAGHFPGNPIVPGAWLLAEAVREISAAAGFNAAAVAVKSAKFFRPVRPGDSVEIEYAISADEIRFQCAVAGAKVMAGVMAGAARGAADAAAGE
jgi:3-hydroxyacyl-[acyl-carrier-protein] dehydratase